MDGLRVQWDDEYAYWKQYIENKTKPKIIKWPFWLYQVIFEFKRWKNLKIWKHIKTIIILLAVLLSYFINYWRKTRNKTQVSVRKKNKTSSILCRTTCTKSSNNSNSKKVSSPKQPAAAWQRKVRIHIYRKSGITTTLKIETRSRRQYTMCSVCFSLGAVFLSFQFFVRFFSNFVFECMLFIYGTTQQKWTYWIRRRRSNERQKKKFCLSIEREWSLFCFPLRSLFMHYYCPIVLFFFCIFFLLIFMYSSSGWFFSFIVFCSLNVLLWMCVMCSCVHCTVQRNSYPYNNNFVLNIYIQFAIRCCC